MGRSGGGVLELTPVPEQPCRAAIRVKPLGFPWPMGLVADQASSRVAPGCAERLSGWRPMRRVGAAGATTFLSTSSLAGPRSASGLWGSPGQWGW